MNVPIGVFSFMIASVFIQEAGLLAKQRTVYGRIDCLGVVLLIPSLGMLPTCARSRPAR